MRPVLFAAVVFPAVLVVMASLQGPGVSVDSVSYLAAAQSWARDFELISYNGDDLTIFPPGLSILLGSVVALGIPVSIGVVGLNVIAVVGLVLIAFLIGRQVLEDERWAVLAALVMSTSVIIIEAHTYVWTEPLFSLLLGAALLLLVRAVRLHTVSWGVVVALGVVLGAASTFRYVGVVIVPIAAVTIWLAADRRRAIKVLVFMGTALVLPVAVVVRNVSLGVGPFGERYPGTLTWDGAISQVFMQWGEVVAPSRTTSLTLVAGVVVAVLIMSGGWLSLIRRNWAGLLLFVVVGLYWVAIVASQTGARLDIESSRFGVPVAIPSIILALLAVRAMVVTMQQQLATAGLLSLRRSHTLVLTVLIAVATVIAVLSVFHSVQFAVQARSEGLGLNAKGNTERALVRLAEQQPTDVVIASNDPWSAWWARGGGVVIDLPPSEVEWPLARLERDTQRLQDRLESGVPIVALFDEGGPASASAQILAEQGIVLEEEGRQDGVIIGRVLGR